MKLSPNNNNEHAQDYYGEFCFQFEFFVNFDFQMHKTNLQSFVFEILFIGDYNSTFYLFGGRV